MKKQTYNEEINISKFLINLWKEKFKIISITSLFLVLGYLYSTTLVNTYEASTNIKPIPNFENKKYRTYNGVAEDDLLKIDQSILLNLFITKIQDLTILRNAIVKFKLIDKDKFKSNEVFEEEVSRISILIIENIKPPAPEKEKPYWSINFNIICD